MQQALIIYPNDVTSLENLQKLLSNGWRVIHVAAGHIVPNRQQETSFIYPLYGHFLVIIEQTPQETQK